MHIISDPSRCSQQLDSFARHTMAHYVNTISRSGPSGLKKKHFLAWKSAKTWNSRVLKSPYFLNS